MTELLEPMDSYDPRLARDASGPFAELNAAGVLSAADVHVAEALGRLCREPSPESVLAAALTVRATRTGSVCLDLQDVASALPDHPWPEPGAWLAAVGASTLVAEQVLRLEGRLIYLDRYWQAEGSVVDDLRRRRDLPAPAVDEQRLAEALDALFPDPTYAEQRQAADDTVRRRTSVITGGPGTGKTTTLARVLAALAHLHGSADGGSRLRVALAAPTGKAAARMSQAIAQAAEHPDFPAEHRAAIAGLTATTLHRLLGTRPDNGTRFTHHRGNRLVHDVVVVDEVSMVSLTLMARLLEAVRPEARLVLVGDPDQLASVEAGAVLRDLVDGLAGSDSPVSQLRTVHRFGSGIGALAAAVRAGDAAETLRVLEQAPPGVEWIDTEARVREVVEDHAVALMRAASESEDAAILTALEQHRLLCAHREGPYGVTHWNRQIERWLMEHTGRDWLEHRYAGQPLLVTTNDYGLRLWNGDTGVVTATRPGPDGVAFARALFADGSAAGRSVPLSRLADVETAHAMTVHRAQGSQFREVTVVLPPHDSPLATRELFYTALTRAQETVRVVGDPAAVEAAVTGRVRRATGLAQRL